MQFLKILFFTYFYGLINASEDEFRLIKDLKENYDPIERPVKNHSSSVDVSLRLILQQIVDVDEKNQILQLVLWTQYKWQDYKMVWNPMEYGNLSEIRLPSTELWIPDILLFTSADENFDARFAVNCVVKHTGEVLYAPPSIIKSSCRIDITWFPFDDQLCFLKYGSWSYSARELNLFIDETDLNEDRNKMDLAYYVPNGEWELLGTPANRISSGFAGSEYVELYFYLHISRKSVYYGMNWIIPSALISMSNILGFMLPPECGEKITLQITNLLSVTVFLGIVAEVTPPTSESVPAIAAFFSTSMIILGVSIFFTLIIINVFFRSPKTHKMSSTTRKVFLEWLPWMLLMNRPGIKYRKLNDIFKDEENIDVVIPKPSFKKPELRRNDVSVERMVRQGSANSLENVKVYKRDLLIHEAAHGGAVLMNALKKSMPSPSSQDCKCECHGDAESSTSSSSADTDHLLIYDTLKELNSYIRLRRRIITEEEEEEDLQADWRYMAMVIDRLCLYVFSFATVLSMILIFFAIGRNAPNELY